MLFGTFTRPCILQAALVGSSQRQDVMDLLEKRIRSRFSHRRMLLGDPFIDSAPAGTAGQAHALWQHDSAACDQTVTFWAAWFVDCIEDQIPAFAPHG